MVHALNEWARREPAGPVTVLGARTTALREGRSSTGRIPDITADGTLRPEQESPQQPVCAPTRNRLSAWEHSLALEATAQQAVCQGCLGTDVTPVTADAWPRGVRGALPPQLCVSMLRRMQSCHFSLATQTAPALFLACRPTSANGIR